jgi:hypothetical protein
MSPWALERRRLSYAVMRIIDPAAGSDRFVQIPPAADYSDLMLDEMTVIVGLPILASDAESEARRMAIIAEYDARYWRQRQKAGAAATSPSTSPAAAPDPTRS